MAFKKFPTDHSSYAQQGGAQGSAGYRPAYTPGSQGHAANSAYSRQAATNQYSRNNPLYSAKASRRMGRGKKIAVGVIAAVLIAVVGCGTAFALYMNSVGSDLNRGSKTDEEIKAIDDALTKKSYNEPFYMLLIGSDRRENNEAMGARSDTNIVVRVDPVNNQATLVSIPRDTKIDIDGYGTNKFNAAYTFGGAAGTIKEANQLLDIEISCYAEVNFSDLVDLVDAVGGVDVEVDERIEDPKAGDVVIEEGEQHLDGEAALVFSRSRQYVDGDFTRTSNQRKLIMAIVNKVLDLPVTELPGVIQSAAKCVTTNLSVNDIIGLAQQFQDEGDLVLYSAMLPSYTQDIDGISYVINDEEATKEMMTVVDAGGDPSGIVSSMNAMTESDSELSTGVEDDGYVDGYYDNGTYYEDGTQGYDPNYDPNYYEGTETESYGDGSGWVEQAY